MREFGDLRLTSELRRHAADLLRGERTRVPRLRRLRAAETRRENKESFGTSTGETPRFSGRPTLEELFADVTNEGLMTPRAYHAVWDYDYPLAKIGRAGPRLLPDETAARRQGRRGLGLSLWVAALLGALSALGNESVARALANITPGITAMVLRTQVVFVALAARAVLGERVSARFWVGASLALGGMAMLRFSGEAPVVILWGMTWAGPWWPPPPFGTMQVVVRHSIQGIDAMLINALRLWLASR